MRVVAVRRSKNRVHVGGRFSTSATTLSQQLLTAFEKMAGELQRDIRSDVREEAGGGAGDPSVRWLREVMVRTPFFARILSQFWMSSTPWCRSERPTH